MKPYFEVERPPCPFYGFSGMFGSLRDSGGNQCALKKDADSSCVMEMKGEEPNWNLCPIHRQNSSDGNGKRLEEISERIQIFPREFRPPKAEHWRGISLKYWMNRFLNRD